MLPEVCETSQDLSRLSWAFKSRETPDYSFFGSLKSLVDIKLENFFRGVSYKQSAVVLLTLSKNTHWEATELGSWSLILILFILPFTFGFAVDFFPIQDDLLFALPLLVDDFKTDYTN
jgi:hypothetical protein